MTARVTALHTREQFSFDVGASLDVAWPLFGAERERAGGSGGFFAS